MGWPEVDNKLKTRLDAKFVSCTEAYERKHIEDSVWEAYPGKWPRATIQAAIQACCLAVPAPRPRDEYLTCLRKRLTGQ